jgi:hypothetical protein
MGEEVKKFGALTEKAKSAMYVYLEDCDSRSLDPHTCYGGAEKCQALKADFVLGKKNSSRRVRFMSFRIGRGLPV